jgi:hypothetical protein
MRRRNCQRDHQLMNDEERAKVPASFWSKGRKGASSGQGSDADGNESEKGGARITGAKLKEKERGQRSWVADTQTMVRCAPMARNVAGSGRMTNPADPRRNLAEDLCVNGGKTKTGKLQKRGLPTTIQLAVLGLRPD